MKMKRVNRKERKELRRGNRIRATKMYFDRTGCSLKEAMEQMRAVNI